MRKHDAVPGDMIQRTRHYRKVAYDQRGMCNDQGVPLWYGEENLGCLNAQIARAAAFFNQRFNIREDCPRCQGSGRDSFAVRLSDRELVGRIVEIMTQAPLWPSDTLQDIAKVLIENGYRFPEPAGRHRRRDIGAGPRRQLAGYRLSRRRALLQIKRLEAKVAALDATIAEMEGSS
jgi:hypothetical protein